MGFENALAEEIWTAKYRFVSIVGRQRKVAYRARISAFIAPYDNWRLRHH